jgi:vacuolar protein sorting-associated protein 13A/C
MDMSINLLHGMEAKFGFSNFRTKEFKHVNHYVHIIVLGKRKKLLINRDKKYFFTVPYTCNNSNPTDISLCVEIKLIEGRKVITIHSGIEIVNNTNKTWKLGAYNLEQEAVDPSLFAVLKPGGNAYVPCTYISSGAMLTIRPDTSEFNWFAKKKDYCFERLASGSFNLLVRCKNSNGKDRMSCVLHVTQLAHNSNDRKKIINSKINIIAPLAIENTLGLCANFTILTKSRRDANKMNTIWSQVLACGEKQYMYNIDIRRDLWLQCVVEQNGVQWKTMDVSLISSPKIDIPLGTQFINVDPNGKELILKLDYCYTMNSYHEVCVYCSYWIINRTNLKLTLKVGDEEAPGQEPRKQKQLSPVKQEFTSSENSHNNQSVEPLLFDYRNGNIIFANKINVKVNNTYSSQPFSIDSVGDNMDIDVDNGTHRFTIGVSVDIGPGKFKRTKFITFTPKYIFVNRTDCEITAKQYGSSTELKLAQLSTQYFYWTERKQVATMVTMKLDYTEWSVPFRLDNTGEISLILKNTRRLVTNPKKKKTYVTVQMHQEKSIVFVVFELAQYPPYYIYNKTGYDLILGQHGVAGLFLLKSNSKAPFSWPDQTRDHIIAIHIGKKYVETLDADIVSNRKWISMKEFNKSILVTVSAQGYTRVIQFTEQEGLVDSIKNSSGAVTDSPDDQLVANLSNDQTLVWIEVGLDIRGIGLSISDSRPEEIVYVLFDSLNLKFRMIDNKQFIEARLHRLQINNQTHNAAYPVLFTNSKKLEIGTDFIHIGLIRSHTEHSYDCIPYFSFLMQETDVAFDFKFVNRIYDMAVQLMEVLDRDNNEENDLRLDRDKLLSITILSNKYTGSKHKKVYFELMQLHPIRINFSFLFNLEDTSPTTSISTQTRQENQTLLILQTIGAHLHANIDQAPIRLNALILQHVFLGREALLETIQKHYKKSAVSELYKLLGSFSSIGNPIGLFNGLFKLSKLW